MNNTILEKKKRVSDQILYALIQLSSFLSIFILLVIIGYILYRGIPAFDFSYLVNTTSIINDTVGILPNIINTLYIVIVTLLIACPIGIGGAIYLNEYTKNKKFVSIISFTTEVLAGIPINYLWIIWDVVLWIILSFEFLYFNRVTYTCYYDFTNHFKKYSNSIRMCAKKLS